MWVGNEVSNADSKVDVMNSSQLVGLWVWSHHPRKWSVSGEALPP